MTQQTLTRRAALALLTGTLALFAAPSSSATAMMTSTVIVEISCDDATHLYWREQGSQNWTQLEADPGSAPYIVAPDDVTTTFVFVQDAGSNEDVLIRIGSGGSQSLPASTSVNPDQRVQIQATREGSSPRWYAGYVKVPVG